MVVARSWEASKRDLPIGSCRGMQGAADVFSCIQETAGSSLRKAAATGGSRTCCSLSHSLESQQRLLIPTRFPSFYHGTLGINHCTRSELAFGRASPQELPLAAGSLHRGRKRSSFGPNSPPHSHALVSVHVPWYSCILMYLWGQRVMGRIRLIVAGMEIQCHRAPGSISGQCLEVPGKTR